MKTMLKNSMRAGALAAGLFLGGLVAVQAISLWSSRSGDVNLPGLTANWPAGTYTKGTPLTGFSYYFQNPQTQMIFAPAGTLAAGDVFMASSPPDGQEACIFSTQIVTALLVGANTGQTINNAVTTIGANARVCYTYSVSNKTWDRSQ